MKISNCIVGIDPGASGGIAFIDEQNRAAAHKMPETEGDIVELLSEFSPSTICYLEKVGAMPGQGVSSMFKFGQGYGFLRGVLYSLNFRIENVTPQSWQKYLGCLTKGDKNVTKRKAQELFPGIKITHAIADSLLIAEYGRRIEATRKP